MKTVAIEVPCSPPDLLEWAKEQNFTLNDVSSQTSVTIHPSSCTVTKNGLVKGIFNHETDGIAYLLGLHLVEKLTGLEKSKEQGDQLQ